MSRLTERSKKIIAGSLLAQLANDTKNSDRPPEEWLTNVRDICMIAKQLGIGSVALAGAYFEQPLLADSLKLKDCFDQTLQKTLGDDYALEFIENLSRYEKAFIDHHNSKTVD